MSYEYFNENPRAKSVGDCAIRALSIALGQTWGETYVDLALEGFIGGDLPNADSIWGSYLARKGFSKNFIPDDCPECMTVERFAKENPNGTFVLSMPGRHVVTVVNGDWIDSWDSGAEIPTYYFAKKSESDS